MLQRKVLDHGYVRVIRVDGNDGQIAQTARTSTESEGDASKDARLVRRLVRDRHTSPVEFVGLVLEIQMPIFVARQWMRHRTGSFNEFSLRYSEAPDIFYVPEASRCQAQSTFNKQGSAEQLDEDAVDYIQGEIETQSRQAYRSYRSLLDHGLTRELARCVLPVNFYTKVRWRIDLHNLMHFMKLREDPHAQWEVREYAKVIHEFCKDLFPEAMSAFEDHVQNVQTISPQLAALLVKNFYLDVETDPALKSELEEFLRRNQNGL